MAEGDAVRHVHALLRGLARAQWRSLEETHVGNVSWLRAELAQVSRSLELTPQFETLNAVSAAPFPRDLEDVVGPPLKKHKTEKKSETRRKRGRPARGPLIDPEGLKVVQLRSELKKRGLRTSGLKAVLCNRLLDALHEEEGQLQKVEEIEVIVIDDEEDEIVRESVGSNKLRSRSTSPKVVAATEDVAEKVDGARRSSPDQLTGHEEGSGTGRREETPATGVEEAAAESDAEKVQQVVSSETTGREDKFAIEDGSKDLVTHDETSRPGDEFAIENASETHDGKLTRKSVQFIDKSALSSPLARKRKSILRKASSLAPGTRGLDRKISFAPTDKVDIIFESSQTDSSQPDSSPEKSTLSDDGHSPRRNSHDDNANVVVESSETYLTQVDPSPERPSRSDEGHSTPRGVPSDNTNTFSEAEEKPQSVRTPVVSPEKATLSDGGHSPRRDIQDANTNVCPEAEAKPQSVGTPVAAAAASTEDPTPTEVVPEIETEEERKEREFQANVAREAQRLRLAARLSAKKRLEEAKATKAFWARRNEQKSKIQDFTAGDTNTRAQTPVSSFEHPPAYPPTSTPSTTDERSSTASKNGMGTQNSTVSRAQPEPEPNHHTSVRSIVRQDDVEEISNVSSTFESAVRGPRAPRSTYSVVEKDHGQIERSMSYRLDDKPTAKSMPAVVSAPPTESFSVLGIKKLPNQNLGSSSLSTSYGTKKSGSPSIQSSEPLETRNRSDSMSSTVSSILDPSIVEDTLKSGASTTANGSRKPISNLVSGLHSFTTLLDKDLSQESNSSRSAPVVNALKMAERSRLLEEKKKLEKEKRKAILKKKMEEHKKTAALKVQAEKDAQEKREQERLNERKKREAELARKRQQKLKEMRAGLEKKRVAMLAAEKKAAFSATTASRSAASASSTSHHKYRGLAGASAASQSSAKPMEKPVSKLLPKPVSKPAQLSRPASKPVSKTGPKAMLTSPLPGKHAPKSHSTEIVSYEMSDNAESSDGESSDSERHGKKKVPRWAQRDHLNKILHAQFGKNAVDPSPIFPDFVDTCNLEAIFDETTDIRKKKRFARRTSSGNWLADQPTARDRALYRRDMGYKR